MGNWDFDFDEGFFFLVTAGIAVAGMILWYLRIFRRPKFVQTGSTRTILAAAPVVGIISLLVVLNKWADPKYVVGQLDYILLFLSGGIAWMWMIAWLTPWLGISPTHDAIDRSNDAAAISIGGAILGAMAIYAYCNIGSGPTIWTTILPAVVATIAWLVIWLIVEIVSGISERVTIDRDVACGFRHAGILLAVGLILGRAMAGDWTSWQETFDSFRQIAWPAALFVPIAVALNFIYRPTPNCPTPARWNAGVVPALAIIIVAVVYITSLGRPDIGVHVITYEQYMGKQE